jgi:hypothetical protein
MALEDRVLGPSGGARIPELAAPDQHGRIQTFNSLRGANGAVIVFIRSADW